MGSSNGRTARSSGRAANYRATPEDPRVHADRVSDRPCGLVPPCPIGDPAQQAGLRNRPQPSEVGSHEGRRRQPKTPPPGGWAWSIAPATRPSPAATSAPPTRRTSTPRATQGGVQLAVRFPGPRRRPCRPQSTHHRPATADEDMQPGHVERVRSRRHRSSAPACSSARGDEPSRTSC